MGTITYTAQRSLVSGHTAGTEYALEVPFEEWTPQSQPNTDETESLSGRVFTTLHRIDKMWRVGIMETEDQAVLDQMEEFFDSVAAGEVFTINALGTPRVVKIQGAPSWNRTSTIPHYAATFTVRKVL